MKNIVLSLVLILAASAVDAQPLVSAVDMRAVRDYATKLLPRCEGGTVAFDPVPGKGPSGFHTYRAVLKSSDQYCGAAKHVLYSPATKQMLVGSVVPLPGGEQPIHDRISTHFSNLLKSQITATISPMKLPDGLRQTTLTKQTPYGPFSYLGYLDESEKFLIVGLRGELGEDPAATLRKEIGVSSAARRGNGAGKVEIVEISDFQCPTCARAHEAMEPMFQANLSKISYNRIDLPLFEHHDWAIKASLGSRALQRVAPGKYWGYVDAVFNNQENLTAANFDAFIKGWAEDNDVAWSSIEKIYNSPAEKKTLLESVSRLFSAGVTSTPTYIVNGQILGYGTGTFVEQFIKDLLVK